MKPSSRSWRRLRQRSYRIRYTLLAAHRLAVIQTDCCAEWMGNFTAQRNPAVAMVRAQFSDLIPTDLRLNFTRSAEALMAPGQAANCWNAEMGISLALLTQAAPMPLAPYSGLAPMALSPLFLI